MTQHAAITISATGRPEARAQGIEICPKCLDWPTAPPGGTCRWCAALDDNEMCAALMRQLAAESIARLVRPRLDAVRLT